MNGMPLIQRLLAEGPVLTDGAWGTQLQARGLSSGEFPDLWNLTHPDRVADVARDYVDAGSRVILTNTFGANRLRLQEAGLADRVAAINEAGVRISRDAAGKRACVFASLGPTGKTPLADEVSPAEISEAFREQATALASGGADALVVETMSDLDIRMSLTFPTRTTGSISTLTKARRLSPFATIGVRRRDS